MPAAGAHPWPKIDPFRVQSFCVQTNRLAKSFFGKERAMFVFFILEINWDEVFSDVRDKY